MNEAKWLRSKRPGDMLTFLEKRQASDRKLRLFAVACSRRTDTERSPEEKAEERAVEDLTERFADGLATEDELADAAICKVDDSEGASWCVADTDAVKAARAFTHDFWKQVKQTAKAALFRDLFGNP